MPLEPDAVDTETKNSAVLSDASLSSSYAAWDGCTSPHPHPPEGSIPTSTIWQYYLQTALADLTCRLKCSPAKHVVQTAKLNEVRSPDRALLLYARFSLCFIGVPFWGGGGSEMP